MPVMNFRVSDEQKAQIEALARKAGVKPSEWMRQRSLSHGDVTSTPPSTPPTPETSLPPLDAVEIEALARKIYNTEGVPKIVARREALAYAEEREREVEEDWERKREAREREFDL